MTDLTDNLRRLFLWLEDPGPGELSRILPSQRTVVLVLSTLFLVTSTFCLPETVRGITPVRSGDETPLYETFELTWVVPGVTGNRFSQFVAVTFSRDGRSFLVDGFYDGDDVWRARFMPDQEGVWSWSWSFQGNTGSGTFACTPRVNADNHGHVRRDPNHPRYLVHDDGTSHYWYGASWIGGNRYGPQSKGDEQNRKRVSSADFRSYFDVLEANRINGMLLEVQLYPLEQDGWAWDLEWIRQAEFLVREMAARNIVCHISMFGTWARSREAWFESDVRGSHQILNAWRSGQSDKKKNYVRTLVARFAGFPNVYWELGNEMGHRPNSGRAFVNLANKEYIPWLRQYDPYDLPIGLSEDDVWDASVDVEFSHQTNQLPTLSATKPRIMNELVRGGVDGLKMWKDTTIRNSRARLGYRRTFWRVFSYGGCGASAASLVRFGSEHPFNQAVLDVLGDQMRLRNFLESLPVPINEMDTDPAFVVDGPGTYRTRRKPGHCYVTYFLLARPGDSVESGVTSLRLPDGEYVATWFSPTEGTSGDEIRIEASGALTTISHPGFREDIVLWIVKDTSGGF